MLRQMIPLIVFILIAIITTLVLYYSTTSTTSTTSKSCPENSNDNYTFGSNAVLGSELLKMFIGTLKSMSQYIHKIL